MALSRYDNIVFWGVFNIGKYAYITTLYAVLLFSYMLTIFLSIFLVPVSLIGKKIFPCNKVFIGLTDVARQSQDIALCVEKIGYKPDVFLVRNSKSLYDINGRVLRIPFAACSFPYLSFFFIKLSLCFYFLKYLIQYQHFVLLFQETFLPLSLDSAIFKISGKNICRCFFGDDIRYRPVQWKIDDFIFGKKTPWSHYHFVSSNLQFMRCFFTMFVLKLFKVKYVGDYNTCTFAQYPFYKGFSLIYDAMPQRKIANDVPYVLFCPSRSGDKNAGFVLKAIRELKQRGIKFKFVYLKGVKNQVVLENLKKADIVIDQPSTTIARLASEAIAYRCCVVTNFKKPYQNYDEPPPIVDYNWDFDLFINDLAHLIQNKDHRQSIMDKTAVFYKKNISIEACVKIFEQLFHGKEKPYSKLIPEYKKLLLRSCENNFQKIIIKLFYTA